MLLPNPTLAYRRASTQTAPPGQLVLMLYEGTIRFLERALTGFEHQDPAEFNGTINNNIQRAQEIIRELDRSLNLAEGGKLASELRRLYDYFDRRLTESNFKKKPEGIHEVINRLSTLRDAWAAMLKGDRLATDQEPSSFAMSTAAG